VQLIRQKRLYQQIAEHICALVAAGEMAPGSRLPGEKELARTLGVSRPSLREALIVLETAEIVEVVNGAGSFVRADADPARLPWRNGDYGPGPLEQFRARAILEPELAAEAAHQITRPEIDALAALVERIARQLRSATRVTPDHFTFHEKLAAASRNQVLAQVVRDLLARTQTERTWQTVRSRVDTAANLQAGLAFRHQLLERLRAGDARASRRLMRRHLDRIGGLYFGEDYRRAAERPGHPAADATPQPSNPPAAADRRPAGVIRARATG